MKTAVRFFSQTGNTKKIADKIADIAGCKSESVTVGLDEKVDILFLGASVYGASIAKQVSDFIARLHAEDIGQVVVFSTSAISKRGYKLMKRELKTRKIPVADEHFYCKGQFYGLHKGYPDAKDLEKVIEFTNKVLTQ